nr:stage III sporulation protein AA [Maliibacterium massiliense]
MIPSAWTQMLRVMPRALQACLQALPEQTVDALEEVRIRAGAPIELVFHKQSLQQRTLLQGQPDVDTSLCQRLMEGICQHSIYAVEDQLRQGYVSLAHGLRVGVAGHVVLRKGESVAFIAPASSFCFRMGRAVAGCADAVLPYVKQLGMYVNTLVLSPPRAGKTTLLRDMARVASVQGRHVVLVDERGELSGSEQGVSQFDLGPCCDVLEGAPKAEGMMMMIRSMAPDILVTDEIGRQEDVSALIEACNAGVCVFASAHASSLETAKARPMLASCLAQQLFRRIVVLSRRRGAGTLEQIIDAQSGRDLLPQRAQARLGKEAVPCG